jgi:hypothetical protein
MLNRSVYSGHPCLVPDFRGNGFSSSPLSIMLAVGLSYTAFIILRVFPSIYIGISLTREVKCIYDEDYITLWKEIEDVTGG